MASLPSARLAALEGELGWDSLNTSDVLTKGSLEFTLAGDDVVLKLVCETCTVSFLKWKSS